MDVYVFDLTTVKVLSKYVLLVSTLSYVGERYVLDNCVLTYVTTKHTLEGSDFESVDGVSTSVERSLETTVYAPSIFTVVNCGI